MSGNGNSLVGFPVGKTRQPDNDRFIEINSVDSDCRKCRVPTGEETPRGIESQEFPEYLTLRGRSGWSNVFMLLALNDADDRR
jgi:hypothetical protein